MSCAKLSVNINKYALIRNSRGHDAPSLRWAIDTCLAAGAHGITIHPRGDQRHIRFDDVPIVAEHLRQNHPLIELNIECALEPFFVDMVLNIAPAQCTLVPVRPGEITSDHGWDIPKFQSLLHPAIHRLKQAGIRTSLFMDCDPDIMEGAVKVGADRVELYTGPYAWAWGGAEQESATNAVLDSVQSARELGLGVNAGHDLDRHNLPALQPARGLLEVSIGHAQVCRALEVGTTQSVQELLTALGW
jgi:pyridoxine 5-phosphate synthase